jgi:hypothetical protein
MNLLNKINTFTDSGQFIYYYYQLKKINEFNALSIIVTKKKLKGVTRKKRLKKRILFKVVILQIEKMIFKLIRFNTILTLSNVFTLLKVRSNLKVPKNAVIWRN